MNFILSFPWHYDPYGIIVETRPKNKISPYAHVPKPEIENFMNQTEWKQNTLLDTEKTTFTFQHFTYHHSTGTSKEESQKRSLSFSHRSLSRIFPSLQEEDQD